MAINVSGVQSFTDAELLVLWRHALAALSSGQSYNINGRALTRSNLKEARDMVEWLESRIESDSSAGSSNMTAYATFERPS